MLTRLSWRGFRNLADCEWRPAAGRNLLLGGNGAGKTSLLEAVYLLATTRSFRAVRLEDCARHGGEGFHLVGEVDGGRRSRLELGWSAAGRSRRLDGGTASLIEHLAVLPVVCWSAADVELVAGGPAVRRRFLDQGVVGLRPGALEVMARYRQALAQKRRLLESGGGGLQSWNEVLAGAAAELVALRRGYVELLAERLDEVLRSAEPGLPGVTLAYRPSIDATEPARVLERLTAGRRQEEARRRPLAGPHRDELEIRWAGHEARRVASAGERKALGLALVAARGAVLAARDRRPIFLLDDVDTELDRGRLARFWGLFSEAEQVFASSNREGAWEDFGGVTRWRLEAGRLAGGRDSSAPG